MDIEKYIKDEQEKSCKTKSVNIMRIQENMMAKLMSKCR